MQLALVISARDQSRGTLKGVQQGLAGVGTAAAGADKQVAGMGATLQGLASAAAAPAGALGKLGSAVGGALGSLGQIGLAGAGLGAITSGIAGAAGAVAGLVTQASDLNESLSKTGVVFGDAAGQVTDFAAQTAQSMGISKAQALAAASSFGTLFTGMGLAQQPAAAMSTQLVTLAADLASFNNIPVDEALEKLRSGLVGEAEPLRSVGVLINEAAVKAKAMELGLAGAGGELTEAAKVQARYALILEQTQTAQGDFARTSTGLANATRIIQASFADVRAELGQQLLPVVAQAASWFAKSLPGALQTARDVLGQLGAVWQQVMSGDLKGALDSMLGLLGQLRARLEPVLAAWGQALKDWIAAAWPPVLEALRDFAGDVFAWISDQAPPFLEQLIGEWIPAFVGWVGEVITKLTPELLKLLAALGRWFDTEGGPALARLGFRLGGALVRGLVAALGTLASALGEALDEAFRANPLLRVVLAGVPGGALLTPEARAGLVPVVSGAAGALAPSPRAPVAPAPPAGPTVVVEQGAVQVNGHDDAALTARLAEEQQRFLEDFAMTAATTDPGASSRLEGVGR